MNVWEFLGENDISKIRFRQPEEFSPYCEWVSTEQLHHHSGIQQKEDEQSDDKKNIDNMLLEYNCFYRYEEMFEPLFGADISKQLKEYFTDLFLHYLFHTEFRCGITSEEYHIRYYKNMIERNEYGQDVKVTFGMLNKRLKHFVARSLYKQARVGDSKSLYAKVVTTLFDLCAVYESKLHKKELLVYIPYKCEGSKKQILKMAEELFLPISYKVRIFNGRHPGIIDENPTMRIDQTEIY